MYYRSVQQFNDVRCRIVSYKHRLEQPDIIVYENNLVLQTIELTFQNALNKSKFGMKF